MSFSVCIEKYLAVFSLCFLLVELRQTITSSFLNSGHQIELMLYPLHDTTLDKAYCCKAGTDTERIKKHRWPAPGGLYCGAGRQGNQHNVMTDGSGPHHIFNDANIPSAVNRAAFASFITSGQTCVSGTRFLVQSGVYYAFVSQFLEKVKSITKRMGDHASIRRMDKTEQR
jgi:aldehyde dehydrogenase family protein